MNIQNKTRSKPMRKKRYRHRDKLKLMHNCLKHYKRFEKSLKTMENKLAKMYIKQRLNSLYGTSVYFGDVLYNDTDSVTPEEANYIEHDNAIITDFFKKQEV